MNIANNRRQEIQIDYRAHIFTSLQQQCIENNGIWVSCSVHQTKKTHTTNSESYRNIRNDGNCSNSTDKRNFAIVCILLVIAITIIIVILFHIPCIKRRYQTDTNKRRHSIVVMVADIIYLCCKN